MKKSHILILSFIISSRFFALFIVLPVISLYGRELSGASGLTLGLIIGIYALFQMLFSLPFGLLSDAVGRRSAMLLGLLIFIAGSLICANATTALVMLAGRALQGAGAIGGVATAAIADLSTEAARGKAMAIMGGSIGLAFAAAMLTGPALAHFAGLASLFYLSAALSALAILLLFALPLKNAQKFAKSLRASEVLCIFENKNLNLLYLTNFCQKALVAGVFTILPIAFVHEFARPSGELYKLYSAAMLLGFFAMGAGGVIGESRGKSKAILLAGVALFGAAAAAFICEDFWLFIAGVGLFFTALCLHEPIMQSSLSKICPARLKGSALGFANACGYAGSFCAPLAAAWALSAGAIWLFFACVLGICALWFALLLALENPNDFKTIHFGVHAVSTERLPAIDRGEDERGSWVKINIRKHPIEQICALLGIQCSGASAQIKERK